MSTITTRRQTLALASRYAREEVDARLRDAVSDARAAEERAEGVDTGATRDEVLRAYTDRGQLGPSEGWAGAGAFGLIPERVPERWQPLFLRTLDRVARRYAESKARKVRKVVTLDALKTLKGAARYDAMREVIETEGDIEDECADDVFRRLCVRRTWPKRLGKHPTLSSYGRANRWNFNPLHRGDKETPDQPFQLAPSLSASSPDALYRLMHAVEPFRIVTRAKLGDYYKGGVFRFYSRDRRFMCWVGFHKHEIDLTFYCPREDLFIPSEPTWPEALRCEYKDWEAVIAKPENRVLYDEHHAAQELYNEQGVIVPWCSGRMRCKNPDGAAWMRLVVAVANTPQLIYGGNNFRV